MVMFGRLLEEIEKEGESRDCLRFDHKNLKEEPSQSLRMLVGLRKSWASRPLTVREDTVE